MTPEEYFREWSKDCRLFTNYEPIHDHNDMMRFAEDYHQEQSYTFTQKDLIFKLKVLGFKVEDIATQKGQSGRSLYMNDIVVSGENYPIFGRYCGGDYNPCGFSKQTVFTQEDLDKAIAHCSELMQGKIESVKKVPNYFTIREYLRENFGKTKVEKLAIERVLKLIKENFNDIIRSKH